MKVHMLFLMFALFVTSGNDEKLTHNSNENMNNINAEISSITSAIEELQQKLPTAYTTHDSQHPIMITDILNIKAGIANLKASKANLVVSKANNEASEKLIQSIERFDKRSTKLSICMIGLTIIIAILTTFMAAFTIVQIKGTRRLKSLFQNYESSINETPQAEEATKAPKKEETVESTKTEEATVEDPQTEETTIESPKNNSKDSSPQTSLMRKEANAKAQEPHSVPHPDQSNQDIGTV